LGQKVEEGVASEDDQLRDYDRSAGSPTEERSFGVQVPLKNEEDGGAEGWYDGNRKGNEFKLPVSVE
jgi:hypothetical protein